jgi:CubicO group peptidase (beta-lactamase class C family)
MKKQILIISLGLMFNLAFAQPKEDELLTSQFDKILSDRFKADEPGVTALVSRNGQVIYQKAFGMANLELGVPMQVDNIFRIGSITKQFTAIAILQLMEQGKLDLQDEITKYIPDYPTQGNKITIEHLLTHTSGIQSYTGMKDFIERITLDLKPTEMIDHFKNEPMEFEPGTKWNYNNSGYYLLGYIIEQVSGKTYPEYIEENFFKPLGMSHSLYGSDITIVKNRASGYSRGDNGYENAQAMSMTQPYSAGSIQSTVEDLFKWNQAVHEYKLVKKESLDKAFTNYKLADGTETDYGYGWSFGYVQESPTIEHGGGINGFSTMAIYLPKEDVYAVVFANCECISPKDVAARLAAAAIGKPYDRKEISINKDLLQGYPGVYENAKGEQRIISVSEDQLYSQRGRNQKFRIKAYDKDRFFFPDALLTIEFTRNKKGEIESLTTHSREMNEVWIKTNNPVKTQVELKLDPTLLETYVGEYQIAPAFTFVITRDQDRLFLQATGQMQVEIFAEAENKFFLKVNDAALEFVKDDTGQVTKAILNQGGRSTDAKKIR